MSIRKTLVATSCAAIAVLGTAGTASASGTGAIGGATGSPGILSGNVIQIPLAFPINACGSDISVLAALTGAAGNGCVNS